MNASPRKQGRSYCLEFMLLLFLSAASALLAMELWKGNALFFSLVMSAKALLAGFGAGITGREWRRQAARRRRNECPCRMPFTRGDKQWP